MVVGETGRSMTQKQMLKGVVETYLIFGREQQTWVLFNN